MATTSGRDEVHPPDRAVGKVSDLVDQRSAQGRWILWAAVLGSGIAILDGTVVNIALRSIGESLDASMSDLQWITNAYLLSLASLILLGGSLGDRFGRRRMYMIGIAWFAVASGLCALAQTPEQLIAARLLQGVGAALLTPGSLALIQASFRVEDRAAVIGKWAGLGGVAAAIGPLLGGWIIDNASWQWIFWINVPIAVLILAISGRHVPESRDPEAHGRFDLVGAALGAVGLAGTTYALIEMGVAEPWVVTVSLVVGVLALGAFIAYERLPRNPLVPLNLFRSRTFSFANAMTFLVYGALGAVLFILVLQLQVVSGFSPLEAGLSTLPITFAMLLLSSRSGALAVRIGPRLQMSIGPVICAAGVLLLVPVGEGATFLLDVLPGMTVFSIGLACLVAPLTASVLAAAPDRLAGVASGINNAVARAGSLVAVAALPAMVGLVGADYQDPVALSDGYVRAQLVSAVLLVVGGVLCFVGLPREAPARGF